MKRFFTIVVGALALLAVALISAFVAMRLAIHGGEVEVPNLVGMTVVEASKAAADKGLNLNLEKRFYSPEVPAGHIVQQIPAAGMRVRREWEVRVGESLGAQQVTIPNLTGQSERTAAVSTRRLALEPGSVAHIPAPGPPGVVLSQTPPANTAGVDGPRVSVLVTDPETPPQEALVMPSLLGLSYAAALTRTNAAGLRLVTNYDAPAAGSTALSPVQASLLNLGPPPQPPTATPAKPSGTVMAQSPQPGHKVTKGDAVHVTLMHLAQPAQ